MTQTNLKNNPNSSLLREARLSKGLTLEFVHESTKIPMDALRAIEEGYSTRILSPFYYRGFIKIYADFLGLNVADVLKEYNVSAPQVKSIPTQTPSGKVHPPKGPNIVIVRFGEFKRTFWTTNTKKNLLRLIAFIVVLFVLVKIVGCVANFIKSRPKNPKVTIVKEVKKHSPSKKEQVRKEPVQTEETPPAPQEESKNTVSAQSKNDKVTLAVHAPQDTWIQVKADGKTVFQMTMKKGTVENWEADDKIELSGRNIGDLDLEVNGKDVNLSDSSNRHPKKVVITKNGLTVKK